MSSPMSIRQVQSRLKECDLELVAERIDDQSDPYLCEYQVLVIGQNQQVKATCMSELHEDSMFVRSIRKANEHAEVFWQGTVKIGTDEHLASLRAAIVDSTMRKTVRRALKLCRTAGVVLPAEIAI